MTRYLLDTNVVSNPANASPNARVVRELEARGPSCAIAAPVWHELVFGCELLPAGNGRRRFEDYLRDAIRAVYPILPYDEAASAVHAAERARLQRAGKPMPFVDGQIAAIAVANGLALVTLNAKDFRRFRGLEIEDWS